jgi:exosortase A-associated hydrolase 2
LFCIALAPADSPPLGGILYLHPFAEEMNKSRRMAALQTRAFARDGYLVLQIDLTGCGDSAGDFGEANWDAWKDDVRLGHAWLSERAHPVTFWGLRLGAGLAAEMARELPGIDHLILWQPVGSGELFLNQFLRIKLAGEMLSVGQAQSNTKLLRNRLEAGESVEVGGYRLSPIMARDLVAWKLAEHTPNRPIHWLEVNAGGEIPPASQRIIDHWSQNGASITAQALVGEPFWLTQEIAECPALLDATLNGFMR